MSMKNTKKELVEMVKELKTEFEGCRECLRQNVLARQIDESCILDLKEQNEELEGKQIWYKRNADQMCDVYEYADDLWREDSTYFPKICIREPQEILACLKKLKALPTEIEKHNLHLQEEIDFVSDTCVREVGLAEQEIKKLKEENEKLKKLPSGEKLITALITECSGFSDWVSVNGNDGSVVGYAIHLEESLDEIKEQSVPKDFLFAERATADGKICLLKKQVEELKEQGKKDLEEAYLETQYHTWRDEQIDRWGSPDPDAECEYLNLYSNNQQLIKEIFDEIYSDPTERNLSYNVETQKYDEMESDDEE